MVSLASLIVCMSMVVGSVVVEILAGLILAVSTVRLTPTECLKSLGAPAGEISTGVNDEGGGPVGVESVTQTPKEEVTGRITEAEPLTMGVEVVAAAAVERGELPSGERQLGFFLDPMGEI